MHPTTRGERATRGQIALSVVLFLGVVTIAYGYFRPSRIGLYAGLLVTAGAVISGVIAVVTRGAMRQ
jgi:drug/metabolite transporter (DMT)-like permease